MRMGELPVIRSSPICLPDEGRVKVDNPYVRYTVIEDTQSQIVPTLEKQTY